ncbi:MAG: hypothetical protein R3348_08120 [Xanthomonadales bacterium]|nr:hypothetical protein [Xanthomonadales bacterium]
MKLGFTQSVLWATLVVLIEPLMSPTIAAPPPDVGPPSTISGTLYLTHGDPPDGPPVIAYSLVDEAGREWALNIPASLKGSFSDLAATHGLQVTITGDQTGDRAMNALLMDFADSGPGPSVQDAAAAMALSGSKAFRTLLCRFNGDASEPENLAFFDGMMGSTSPGADHYWQELSYGDIDLAGSSQHDWLELPEPRSGYVDDTDPDNEGSNRTKLFDDCKQVHEDNGVSFAGVFGINLIFNDTLDCCAWGGGRDGFAVTWMPPWSWGTTSHGVLAQEMGHSFGLPHEGCQGTESPYDSDWDPMSNAGGSQIHINAAFKDDLAWISGSRKYIADGSVNQIVDLERLALPEFGGFHADNYLMAQIPIPGESTYYTVEARKFAGYDGSPDSPPFEAVVIHYVDWSLGDKNAVVVHEDDGDIDCNDESGAWTPGELFVDEENGISIAVLSEGDSDFTIAINPATDLSVSKTASPDPVIAGELITYHVTVDNLGPGIATNVVVTDILPDGVHYVADTDACVEGPAGTLTCTADAPILLGGTWSFNILASVDSDIADGLQTSITNFVSVIADQDEGGSNNEFSLTTFAISEADLAVSKECKPDEPLQAGETGTCTIWVDNLGPSMANSVVLTDTHLSEGNFTIGSVSTDTGFCGAPVNGKVTCNLGNMDAGERATVSVDVSSTESVDINDCASAESATPDPNNANNQACDGVSVVAEADLSVTKSDAPDPVVAGTNLTYTINIHNFGPSAATNVVVEDVLSAGVSIVSITPSGGASCNAGVPGNALLPTTCTFGSVPSGGNESVTIVVKVNPDFLGLLENDVAVSSDTPDSNNANNHDTTTTTVVAEADLSVSKSDSPDPVIAGETLKYTVTVLNNGSSVAQGAVLADVLPPEVAYVGTTITVGSGVCVYAPLADTVTCSFDSGLWPGSHFEVVIEVVVDASVPDGAMITNAASASSATADPNPANNSDSEDTTVNALADLEILKDSTFEAGNPSTNLIYILTATNLGSSDAQNVMVRDEFPSTAKKLVYVFDTGDGACSYDKSAHELQCSLGTLAVGESWSVEIHMNAKGNLGTIRNHAFITSDTADPNPDNDMAAKDVIVGGGSDGGGGPPPGRGRP